MGNVASPDAKRPLVLVLMGVSGSGKSTVGALLAGKLGWDFEEGDSLHPQANIDKMAAGHPLTDEDRAPWLRSVADWIDERLDAGQNGIITSSALKRAYRDVLNRRGEGVAFVYLAGDRDTIAKRLALRHEHFMPPALLDSQFGTLEEPTVDEPATRVNIGPSPSVLVNKIVEKFGLDASAERSRS
ncbi:MAG: gluconokinase [Microbacteriaceae bacterium]|jgi:gluconokinase/shikimate kinase|nr:gluconokinase [Microbacteriaceae bacterium]